MPSRRDFLKAVAGTTAGTFIVGRGFAHARVPSFQTSPAKRREVFIGKRRVKVVDIHGHFIAPEEMDIVKNTNLARFVSNTAGGTLTLGPARIQVMDQQGIDIQVLSHQGGWWYEMD